jgi:hypothetical protein
MKGTSAKRKSRYLEYKTSHRMEKNKLSKLIRLSKTHPKDSLITKCIQKLKGVLGL